MVELRELGGLKPKAWIWLPQNSGYSREDLKSFILELFGMESGTSAIQSSVFVSSQDLAELVLKSAGKDIKMMSTDLSIELIERFIKGQRNWTALREIHHSRKLWKEVYTALKTMREKTAHDDELKVISEIADERFGPSMLRNELRQLCFGWDHLLESYGLYDKRRLFLEAAKALDELHEKTWPKVLYKMIPPKRLNMRMEPLETTLEASLQRHFEIREWEIESEVKTRAFKVQLWQQTEDATESAAESADTFVIADDSIVRQSLMRALASRGKFPLDPRDPTKFKNSEALKWALLPLRVVASRFGRNETTSWLLSRFSGEFGPEYQRILDLGQRVELDWFAFKEPFKCEMTELQETFGTSKKGKRFAIDELIEAHLGFLRKRMGSLGQDRVLNPRASALAMLEKIYENLRTDLEQIGERFTKRPILSWVYRLETRVASAPPLADAVRPEDGVPIYRFSQMPLPALKHGLGKMAFVAIPPSVASVARAHGCGDLWLSSSEKDVIGAEYPELSPRLESEIALDQLTFWASLTEEPLFVFPKFTGSGALIESAEPLLRAMALKLGLDSESSVEGLRNPAHAHPRFLASYGPYSVSNNPQWRLSQEQCAVDAVRASQLDSYTRCPFIYLASAIWKAEDLIPAQAQTDALAQGNILHRAIEYRLKDKSLSIEEALEQAWQKDAKRVERSAVVKAAEISRLSKLLKVFFEKEVEYVERSGARVIHVEEPLLEQRFHGVRVYGTPDRIDEVAGGLFLLDYKSSSKLPTGRDIRQSGYRLQLPFYALAARKTFGKEVHGFQFVHLGKQGDRKQGLFPARLNGKKPGCLTQVGGTSGSLYKEDPEVIWAEIESKIEEALSKLKSGVYDAIPIKKDECKSCRTAKICGVVRRNALDSDEDFA